VFPDDAATRPPEWVDPQAANLSGAHAPRLATGIWGNGEARNGSERRGGA